MQKLSKDVAFNVIKMEVEKAIMFEEEQKIKLDQ